MSKIIKMPGEVNPGVHRRSRSTESMFLKKGSGAVKLIIFMMIISLVFIPAQCYCAIINNEAQSVDAPAPACPCSGSCPPSGSSSSVSYDNPGDGMLVDEQGVWANAQNFVNEYNTPAPETRESDIIEEAEPAVQSTGGCGCSSQAQQPVSNYSPISVATAPAGGNAPVSDTPAQSGTISNPEGTIGISNTAGIGQNMPSSSAFSLKGLVPGLLSKQSGLYNNNGFDLLKNTADKTENSFSMPAISKSLNPFNGAESLFNFKPLTKATF
ncbi:hypothetical protein CUJ83_02900 [Methanocella sp. CWC-04]|uniref:Uncharacterized protein n=1 Tax=Methanooceanicella nereidis TaxID=2052831 RepID=A0AAP2RAJ7_9EURY|nr:hypothetical protein [Methanocella sp. CWC-04]MCD1293944.1 hypothetical protein [Methanocella sp. CWC-04]